VEKSVFMADYRRYFTPVIALFLIAATATAAELPNIVVILADDLGYGDVGCYNPESKIPTPHLDRLARQGLRMTDAHSPSTVCTPSRYSLLTGRMCFRTGITGVLTGVDGPLIEQERLTLPGLLKRQGYRTACVGKWHVGMTFLKPDGSPVAPRGGGLAKVREVDFSQRIQDGPTERGFDYFFGTVCCPTTDWLYAYIENHRFVEPPTELVKPATSDWLEYEHFREGLKSPGFDFRQVDMKFLRQSQQFLNRHVKEHPQQPFFLYHATQAAHLPSMPAAEFVGKSHAGPLGDFVVELDFVVGELLRTLDRLGVADNTLVIVTSDNGPEIVATRLREDHGHDSARPWRGFKRDNWEGGHRVPFIARWPGKIAPEQVSHETICLTDLMATCAAITGAALPNNAGEDSVNLLPVFLGENLVKPIREYTLHQTISNDLAIRAGDWKLLDHKGSGGNDYNQPGLRKYRLEDSVPLASGQLYNLAKDPGETMNAWLDQPETAARLTQWLQRAKSAGRSVP
jgi:arylsulfatase A-like enzyme